MTTNSQERRWRINQILAQIPQTEVSKDELFAQIMIKWGFSRRTILEYLNNLISAGFVQEGSGEGAGFVWRK